MRENRMYSEMLKAARSWLMGRQPEDIAQKAKVSFDGSAFHFHSLGIPVTVSYPAYQLKPALDPWHQLIILHYLHLADGTPLSGQQIPFAQLKSGMVRGGGFDRKAETVLSKLELDALKQRCKALHGREKKSSADYCVELSILPMFPVTLNYWQADEEFPASVRLLPDSSGSHYLTIEDAVTAGELLLQKLEG